ncbi:MAG: helix-turn-helix domain-containing protein [Candidatus Bathyarchaeota archaeon]|nr:helix-turn-helix domain-containing protein [Candidatus Bathyarchaeota archaeon]
MVFNENERNEELRKLRDELEGLKEELRRMTASREAEHPPAPKEPFEVPIETSEESEEALEEAEEALEEEVEEIIEEAEEAHEEAEEALEEEVEEEREEYDREDRHRRHRHDYDFGDRLGEYIGGFVEDVMEGVADEIESALFIHPSGPSMVVRRRRPRRKAVVDEKKAASIMSALGNEYRLKILDELSSGGMYASEFQEALKDISPSTLSSHLDTLEEAGLVMQERRRGRYLITIPGRLAVKMAYQIAKRLED